MSMERIDEALSNIHDDTDLKRKANNLKISYKIYLCLFYLSLILISISIYINANS
jgi:hypothetical protein